MSTSVTTTKPQPGEFWRHHVHQRVKVIRRWNNIESECELRSGRRLILADSLMICRLEAKP
jgi:hypothetical protein